MRENRKQRRFRYGLWLLAVGGIWQMIACNSDENVVGLEEQKERDKAIIEEYLANNNINAQQTASGLYYTVSQEGSGSLPNEGDTVAIHYIGQLLYGDIFDRSRTGDGDSLEFTLGAGEVIKGVDEGTALMRLGERRVYYIPSHMGYGLSGSGGAIPSNANLIFDIELVNIRP